MNIRLLAILLLVCGALGLAYGGFSYTKESHRLDLGDLHMEVREKEHVNIPLWLGVGALVAGAALFVTAGRR